MRPIDLIIIYLVVGAPFAAKRVVQRTQGVAFRSYGAALRSYIVSLQEGLFWPWSLTRYVSSRLKRCRNSSALNSPDPSQCFSVEHSLYLCLAALNDFVSIERNAAFRQSTYVETMYRETRDALERYAGLTSALASSSGYEGPAPDELELARLSGLKGDDLLIAGLCVHRRNQSRLKLHQQRSHTELLRVLDSWLNNYLITEGETLQSIPVSRKELLTNLCLRMGDLARACGNPDTQRLVYEKFSEEIAELPANESDLKEGLAFNGGVICSSEGISSHSVKI